MDTVDLAGAVRFGEVFPLAAVRRRWFDVGHVPLSVRGFAIRGCPNGTATGTGPAAVTTPFGTAVVWMTWFDGTVLCEPVPYEGRERAARFASGRGLSMLVEAHWPGHELVDGAAWVAAHEARVAAAAQATANAIVAAAEAEREAQRAKNARVRVRVCRGART